MPVPPGFIMPTTGETSDNEHQSNYQKQLDYSSRGYGPSFFHLLAGISLAIREFMELLVTSISDMKAS